jgi:hypothetical protein
MIGGGSVDFRQLEFVVTFLISSEVCRVEGGAELWREASQLRLVGVNKQGYAKASHRPQVTQAHEPCLLEGGVSSLCASCAPAQPCTALAQAAPAQG